MEPYLIICSSCAARLKVANEALFGQRLACPKCQNMIEVVAPDGFQPRNKPKVTESNAEDFNAEDSLSSNFDDIDSLLANSQFQSSVEQKRPSKKSAIASKGTKPPSAGARPKQNPQPRPRAASGDKRPAVSANAAAGNATTPEATTPTMPGADWDTEATKKKKRVLQIVMLALVALLGLGIGAWALLGNGNTSQSVAKNNESEPESVQEELPSIPEAADRSTLEANQQNSINGAAETRDAHVPETPTRTISPEPDEPPPATASSPSALSPQALVDNSAGKSTPPPLPTVDDTSPTTAPRNPLATPLLATSDPQPSSDPETQDSPLIASTENSLGALSKILKGQGTSLKQIEDIAQLQKERALIGTPTYLIERPSNKPVQVDRLLSAELSGWKLDNVPLIDAIGDLEMLSGLPVSIDPKLFRDGTFDILRSVSLQTQAVTFKDAFEMLLKDDGLELQPNSSGLSVTSTKDSDVVTQSYPQSFCRNEKSSARLKDLIVAVTGINDWDDDAQYQLDVSSDSVTVSHQPQHQEAVAELLKKLTAAAAYKSAPADLEENLRPLALKAEEVLAAAPNLKAINPYRRSMRLGSLLRNARNATKLKTIVDWKNLSEQGWFPNTRIPGRIDEPTNQALLNQLGHAMELTSVVIGDDIIMLTTFENAGKLRDIEVYSVGEIIDNKMKPSQLDQLITETMGVDQITPPNATVIYFAECKCLVASAPQIIQRQLRSIVDELSQQAD